MGILSRLLGRQPEIVEDTRTTEEIQAECSHLTITGRWDSVEDMGHEDRATKFVCESCHAEFTPDETRGLRQRSNPGSGGGATG